MIKLKMNLTCKACEGSGIKVAEVPLGEMINLLESFHVKGQKIEAIKAVRSLGSTDGSLGLKASKELVEAVFNLFDNLESIHAQGNLIEIKS
mgnify:CR=1 FL=1